MLDNLAKKISEIACAAIERSVESMAGYREWIASAPFPVYLVVSFIVATIVTVVIIAAAGTVVVGIVLLTVLAIIERMALSFYRNTRRDWSFYRSDK